MGKKTFYIVLTFLILGFIYSLLRILDIMVSLKYETDGGCISTITGIDLCFMLKCWQAAASLTILGFIGLLVFRKKIVIKNES